MLLDTAGIKDMYSERRKCSLNNVARTERIIMRLSNDSSTQSIQT